MQTLPVAGSLNLMNGDSPGSVMGSLNWGSGFVMFATRTTTNFHTPSAESQNLLQNIISYTADLGGATNCSGTPITFTITVNPTPTVDDVPNQVVCNGATTAPVNFTGAVAGTTFNWTNNNTSIGLAANGTGKNIAGFNAINTGNAPVTADITVTPYYIGGHFF